MICFRKSGLRIKTRWLNLKPTPYQCDNYMLFDIRGRSDLRKVDACEPLVQYPTGGVIVLRSGDGIRESPQVDALTRMANARFVLAVIVADTFEARRIIESLALIGLVLAACGEAQIVAAAIKPVSVYMIDLNAGRDGMAENQGVDGAMEKQRFMPAKIVGIVMDGITIPGIRPASDLDKPGIVGSIHDSHAAFGE
jgi:hypothetical protein